MSEWRRLGWLLFSVVCIVTAYLQAMRLEGEQWQVFAAGFFCMWGIFKAAA